MFLKRLFPIFVLFLLSAASLPAQTTDVSGKYEGTVELQGTGKLNIKGEIRQKDGKLSGVVNTPLGDAQIIEGKISGNNVWLKLDAGGDDAFLSGEAADRKISGEVSGAFKGTFQLQRTGDAGPEMNLPPVLRQSKEKWQADLRFLAEELPKRHKNAFHRISREQFEQSVARLQTKIPSLVDEEIILEMARIVASIGDGHTGLGWGWLFPKVPLRLFWFGKELRVVQVSKDFPRLNGVRLVKIGGLSVEKLYEKSRAYISQGESEQFVLDASTHLLTSPVFLKNAGAAKAYDRADYQFIDLEGKRFSLELKALTQSEKIQWAAPYKTAPLYLQNPDAPFFYKYLPEAKTLYVNFKWYPRRPEFAKFSRELFEFIDKTPVEKLVFDLRQNGGGDLMRGRDFFIKPLKERKQFLERGKLFVIAGRLTYSAGMANTADFRNELKAILVGEPTGARPIGYQENRGFSLPNSHLSVSYSIEYYKFANQDTPGLIPDKLIEPDWKSYLAGRDPVMEWVLAYR
jgi:hypothetical protein